MSPTFSHVIACPKCGRSRADGAAACARCGLVFANWVPDSATGGAAGTGEGGGGVLDAQGEQLWDQLRASWQDEARHDAFLKHCATTGTLAAAGRRYRQRLDEDPRDPLATRMQARIVGMATAALAPTRTAPPVSRSRWFWWVVVACAISGAAAGLFFRTLGR